LGARTATGKSRRIILGCAIEHFEALIFFRVATTWCSAFFVCAIRKLTLSLTGATSSWWTAHLQTSTRDETFDFLPLIEKAKRQTLVLAPGIEFPTRISIDNKTHPLTR